MTPAVKLLALVAGVWVACTGDSARRAPPLAAEGELRVFSAYIPAPPAPDIASLYFTVANAGQLPDTLTAVQTNVGTAMLHEMVTENGLSTMQHVSAIEVAAGEALQLRPGSYHVMLSQLSAPIALGDTIAVTLHFARTGVVTFPAAVLTYTDVVERLESEQGAR